MDSPRVIPTIHFLLIFPNVFFLFSERRLTFLFISLSIATPQPSHSEKKKKKMHSNIDMDTVDKVDSSPLLPRLNVTIPSFTSTSSSTAFGTRQRTRSTPNTPTVSFQKKSAEAASPLNKMEGRRAVQSFRKHVARVRSVDISGCFSPSPLSSASSSVPSSPDAPDAPAVDRTFLIQELQRAHEEIQMNEENLQKAARLGEQLIAWNEALESEVESLTLLKDEEDEDFAAADFSNESNQSNQVGEEEEQKVSNNNLNTLKKRLASMTKHLHDAEQSNDALHHRVEELERAAARHHRRRPEEGGGREGEGEGGDGLETPSHHMVSNSEIVSMEREMKEIKEMNKKTTSEMIESMKANESELDRLRAAGRKSNEAKELLTTSVIALQVDLQKAQAALTSVEKENVMLKSVTIQLTEERDEMKNILSAPRPSKRGRRDSVAAGMLQHRRRLASSLDMDGEEERFVLEKGRRRVKRPSKDVHDPYRLFVTNFRRMVPTSSAF